MAQQIAAVERAGEHAACAQQHGEDKRKKELNHRKKHRENGADAQIEFVSVKLGRLILGMGIPYCDIKLFESPHWTGRSHILLHLQIKVQRGDCDGGLTTPDSWRAYSAVRRTSTLCSRKQCILVRNRAAWSFKYALFVTRVHVSTESHIVVSCRAVQPYNEYRPESYRVRTIYSGLYDSEEDYERLEGAYECG